MESRRLAFFIAALAISVRLFLFVALNRAGVETHSEVENVAASLAERGTFADPFAVPTGPTAHLAPAYPVVLSGLYRIFDSWQSREYAEEILGVLLVSTLFALLPMFSLSLLGSRLPGIFAGLIGALNPGVFISETNGKESPFASVLFFFVCWFTMRSAGRGSHWRWACIGTAWGLLFLVQPVFLLPAAAAAVLFCMTGRKHVKGLLLAGCAAVLVLTPWGIRNAKELGAVVLLRDNLGLELATSFHDGARAEMAPENMVEHPFTNRRAAELVARMGEIRYNQEQLRAALAWVAQHPGTAFGLVVRRTVGFWFPFYRSVPIFLLESVVSGFALVGLFLMIRDGHWAALWVASTLAVYPLVYYVIQSDLRYRYPIQWVLYMCAGFALTVLAERLTGWTGAPAPAAIRAGAGRAAVASRRGLSLSDVA